MFTRRADEAVRRVRSEPCHGPLPKDLRRGPGLPELIHEIVDVLLARTRGKRLHSSRRGIAGPRLRLCRACRVFPGSTGGRNHNSRQRNALQPALLERLDTGQGNTQTASTTMTGRSSDMATSISIARIEKK